MTIGSGHHQIDLLLVDEFSELISLIFSFACEGSASFELDQEMQLLGYLRLILINCGIL
jgi:hypothetical protein